jgi:hypothetical protein
MQRTLSFARSALRLEWQGQVADEIVGFLYRNLVCTQDAEPHRTLRLEALGGDRLTLFRDAERVGEFMELGAAAEALLGESVYHLVDRSSGGLVVHGAALSYDGERALLLPAASGAGKTTLCLWLLAQGARYLTDELVWIPQGGQRLHAFTRPLNLKLGSRAVLDSLLPQPSPQVLRWAAGDLVDPGAFHARKPLASAELALVVFPRYRQGAEPRLEPLTAGKLTQELLGTVANARNLPRHGLGETARLASCVRGFRLEYGDTAQLPELRARLRALLEET